MKRKHEHPDETSRKLQALLADIEALLDRRQRRTETTATPTQPEPAAAVEAATYSLPTNRMRQSLARFDDLSDADQVDVLKAAGW